MATVITAARLLTPFEEMAQPIVTVEDGVVSGIASRNEAEIPSSSRIIDFSDATLAPAFLDVHTHGAAGFDIIQGTDEAFRAMGGFLARHGVGAYLPTTVTAPLDATLAALDRMAQQIERRSATRYTTEAQPLGIHLEGPFLSHEKRGVHPPENLLEPSAAMLQRFWEASRGRIALMTVAPELPQALEMIHEAVRLGIRVSLGHSDADTEGALGAVAAGARSATHTFNAMRALDHREPGLLAVVLDRRDLFAELICDGIHVDPILVRLFYRAKGEERGILITDAMAATGMPDGTYRLGNMDVTVANGRCSYKDSLAGSVLTMDQAVRNFVRFTGAPYSVAVRYAATNPARMMGLEHSHGELLPGRAANLVALSAEGAVQGVILHGERVAV